MIGCEKMKKKTAADIVYENRKEMVNEIISNIKNGYIFPAEKWDRNMFRPQNPITDVKYRGVNKFRLALAAAINGYKDPRWVTYNQVKNTKGLSFKNYDRSQGILCEKWIFEKKVKEKNEDGLLEEKTVKLSRPMVSYFVLYNAQEINGLPELVQSKLERDKTLDICDKFMKSSQCEIEETTDGRAYYIPQGDKIVLPLRDSFRNSEAFFSTVLHEMGHSTGHPTRLGRDQSGLFGSESYAREELRAELSSYFTEADLGIDLGDHGLHHHVMYLDSWIGALENDVNELFHAISDADASTQYLMQNYEKMLAKEEHNIEKNETSISIKEEIDKEEHDEMER